MYSPKEILLTYCGVLVLFPFFQWLTYTACAVGPDNDLSTSESEEETLPGKFYFLC